MISSTPDFLISWDSNISVEVSAHNQSVGFVCGNWKSDEDFLLKKLHTKDNQLSFIYRLEFFVCCIKTLSELKCWADFSQGQELFLAGKTYWETQRCGGSQIGHSRHQLMCNQQLSQFQTGTFETSFSNNNQ